MRIIRPFALLAYALTVLFGPTAPAVRAAESEMRILVYTKNQTGADANGKKYYVHDNIEASVAAIKKLCAENHIAVDVSDDPKVFTPANLKKYKVLVFDNTNNEIFDNEEQKAALQGFIHAGGGFVGLHSASGGMRKWPWFWALVGGKFNRHPKLQAFQITVKDAKDPVTAGLPATFEWTDEFYFLDNMANDLQVLMVGDRSKLDDAGADKYPGKDAPKEWPLAWKHEFEGGRSCYISLGHKSEYYSDPKLSKLMLNAILWAGGSPAKP